MPYDWLYIVSSDWFVETNNLQQMQRGIISSRQFAETNATKSYFLSCRSNCLRNEIVAISHIRPFYIFPEFWDAVVIICSICFLLKYCGTPSWKVTHLKTKQIRCVEIILLQLQINVIIWSPYWGETFSLVGKLVYRSTSYMTTDDLNYTRFEILHVNHMKVQYFCMTMTAHVCTKFKNFKIFLFISLHFTAFLWIPLHFSTFLFTFLHF